MLLLVGGFSLYLVAHLTTYLIQHHAGADPLFGDFYAFWSFARFIHTLPPGQIYDAAGLEAFQHALWNGFDGYYPYAYPPIFLLVLWPLGLLDYLPAYGLWMTASLAAYAAAVGTGRDWREPYPWLAIVAPTTLLAIVSGQNGLMSAALMIGGFRLIQCRPLLGGMLLGALAFKPQLFVLVPLVLLAARQWRALAGAILSGLVLTVFSLIAFGAEIWLIWLRALPTFASQLQDHKDGLWTLMPTLTGTLLSMGVDGRLAQALQAVLAVGVVGTLGVVFARTPRGAAPRMLDIAALQVGVFLVTPYAFIYDMPMVSAAVVTMIEASARTRRPWRSGELTVLAAALFLPIVLFSGMAKGWLVGPPILFLLFLLLVRAGWKRPGTTPQTA